MDVIASRLVTRYSLEELRNEVAVPLWDELAQVAWSALPSSLQNEHSVILAPEESFAFLSEVIQQWDRKCREADCLTRAKWLYVARRIPDVLLDVIATIHDIPKDFIPMARMAIRRLLIAQTGMAPITGQHPMTVGNSAVYDLTRNESAEVIRRLFMIEYLWRVQSTARWAGKGGSVRVKRGFAPDSEPDSELSAATAIFDERMRDSSATSLVGTVPWEESRKPGPRTICFVVDISDPENVTYRPPPDAARTVGGATSDRIRVACTYPIQYVDLTSFRRLSRYIEQGGGLWYDAELPPLLALLHCTSLAIQDDDTIEWQLIRVGYFRMTPLELYTLFSQFDEQIEIFLRDLLPEGHSGNDRPAASIAKLMRMQGEVNPILDGPIIRKDPDGWLLVDVAAASRRLLWRLTVGHYGGAAPNARARHFEASVQESIDSAGFGPKGAWRSLIGRSLKRSDGTAITDIDAMAVIGDTLMLVDAKSYPYTAGYGAGIYNEVRNVTDKLAADIKKWADRMRQLRAQPAGRNYDLSKARLIVGVIVTPFPCYLPRTLAEAESLPGLRAASSLDELRTYLDSRNAETA